jgi:hypothetical protein
MTRPEAERLGPSSSRALRCSRGLAYAGFAADGSRIKSIQAATMKWTLVSLDCAEIVEPTDGTIECNAGL